MLHSHAAEAAAPNAATFEHLTRQPTRLLTLPQNYYSRCSWGQVQFSSANNIIVGPLTVPCSGTSTSMGDYNFNMKCGLPEVYGLAYAADAWAVQVGPVHPPP